MKTRLLRALTPAQAAQLHHALVLDLIESLQQLTDIDVELHTDISTDAWTFPGVPRRLQGKGDLQLKLLHAFREAFAEGRSQVAVAGSDAPALPLAHIAQLFEPAADVTFGPAEDGGFWGIACRRMAEAMFEGVEWSAASTLRQGVAAAQACGLTVAFGATWWDLDEPSDLQRLYAQSGLGAHVRSCIESPEWRASSAGIARGNPSALPRSR